MKNLLFYLGVMALIASCGSNNGAKGDKGEPGPAGTQGEKGDTGAVGPVGATGAKGVQGNPGTNGMTEVTNLSCLKVTGSVLFKYQYVLFSTGDVLVSCSISDSLNQYSDSNFYLSTQQGAASGSCILTYDIDTASGGYWTFEKTPATEAFYTDSGSANNNKVISFLSSDCTSN